MEGLESRLALDGALGAEVAETVEVAQVAEFDPSAIEVVETFEVVDAAGNGDEGGDEAGGEVVYFTLAATTGEVFEAASDDGESPLKPFDPSEDVPADGDEVFVTFGGDVGDEPIRALTADLTPEDGSAVPDEAATDDSGAVDDATDPEKQPTDDVPTDDGVIYTLGGDATEDSPSCHNADLPWDVDANGQVTVQDLVRIVEAMRNNGGPYALPAGAAGEDAPLLYLDVNGDNAVSVTDLVETVGKIRDDQYKSAPASDDSSASDAPFAPGEFNPNDGDSDVLDDESSDDESPTDDSRLAIWAGDDINWNGDVDTVPDDGWSSEGKPWASDAWDDTLDAIAEDVALNAENA